MCREWEAAAATPAVQGHLPAVKGCTIILRTTSYLHGVLTCALQCRTAALYIIIHHFTAHYEANIPVYCL